MNWKALAASLVGLACSLTLLGFACWNWVSSANVPEEPSVAESASSEEPVFETVGEDSSFSPPAESSESSTAILPVEKEDKKALRSILGKEDANKLVERAKDDADASWIATHSDSYKKYGDELQEKLLKLAADEPLAISFVRNFPKKSNADAPDYSAPAMDEEIHEKGIPKTAFPHFYQWDLRWGYTKFSADGFGLAACGPTSLTMVYQGLTKKKDITPYDMGKRAEDEGYVFQEEGSTYGLFTDFAAQLGLVCWEVPVSAESITQTLADGCPIIANVGPGRFSKVGHFFVLAGITEDGQVVLNDPYSPERSSKLWDPELIASESVTLYAYGYQPEEAQQPNTEPEA